MALFHLNVTQTKRSAGQSAIASAACRAGERLYSEYYGEYMEMPLSLHCVTRKQCDHFDHIVLLRNWEINVLPFSLHGFPAPFRRRFPVLPYGVMAGYPMQTVMRFSRSSGQNGNKKAVTKQTSPAFAFSGRSC